MRAHAVFGSFVALCLAIAAVALPRPAVGQGNEEIPENHNADVVKKIAECASEGQETLLFADSFGCAPYQKGGHQLGEKSPQMPLRVDAAQACRDAHNIPFTDKRILPARAIKTIVNDRTKNIDPTGIRVIGAIFCDQLNLIGLNPQYSLAFDRSIFVRGIDGRDFRSSGDLSFDDALVFGELLLTRSHIAGTVFGSNALIQKVRILDSEITGSVLFRQDVILEPVILDTARISGELSLRRSLFPYFLLQFASVGGVLDFTGSQARCSYQVRTSKIGDLVLDEAGFGTASSAGGTVATSFDWIVPEELSKLFNAAKTNRGIVQLSSQNTPSPESVADALTDRSCEYELIAAPSVFVVSDTKVDAQLCVRDFHWLLTSTNQADSFLTLNNVKVATAFIDLTGKAGPPMIAGKPVKRQFEILGLSAQTLILNFGDASHLRSYSSLYANGLGFSQVYAIDDPTGQSATRCGYDPDFAQPDDKKVMLFRQINSVGNLARQRRPRIDEVMPWLTANTAETTQPFSAFVDAFQKSGEINAARELQIKKADTELAGRTTRFLTVWRSAIVGFLIIVGIQLWKRTGTPVRKKIRWSSIFLLLLVGFSLLSPFKLIFQFDTIWSFISGIWSFLTDLVGVAFGSILWLLADNGYRPEKVGWFVILILALSFLYFWFWVKVIAIRPEKRSEPVEGGAPIERKPLPIGLTFLFDRLLPAYQIREDHYKIAEYLMRVPADHKGAKEFPYLWMKLHVVPAEDTVVRRVERALDVIKFCGLVLAIFLVAALNALVSHGAGSQ